MTGGGRRPDTRCQTKEIRNRIRKMTNRICAIDTALPAIPPKPNAAATIAMIKKVIAQPSMTISPQKLLAASGREADALQSAT